MPTSPTYLDQYNMPLTRIVNAVTPALPVPVILPPQVQQIPSIQPIVPIQTMVAGGQGPSPLDIANAALSALGGSLPAAVVQQLQPILAQQSQPQTKVLVLSNMVTDADLATDEEYNGLKDEVEDEVRKFGKLISITIPRPNDTGVEPSAIRKIFLEYATVQDAANAESELKGRQFGPMVVETSFFDEKEYAAKRLK
jgi:splicing factor U2AF 65 kDa subunit